MNSFILQKNNYRLNFSDAEKFIKEIKKKSKFSNIINWDFVRLQIPEHNNCTRADWYIIFPINLLNINREAKFNLKLSLSHLNIYYKDWWKDMNIEIENSFDQQLIMIKREVEVILETINSILI